MKTLWKRKPSGWQKEFYFHSPVHATVSSNPYCWECPGQLDLRSVRSMPLPLLCDLSELQDSSGPQIPLLGHEADQGAVGVATSSPTYQPQR